MDDNNKVPTCNGSDSEKESRYRGNYFALILYPNEDVNHKKMLDYLLSRPQYRVCYIEHQPEDEDKKAHTHVLVHTKDRFTVGAFVKFFQGWINYAECIKSPISYVEYMLHLSPACISAGKRVYDVSELHGDSRLWSYLSQNRYFVQFREVYQFYVPPMTYSQFVAELEKSCYDRPDLIDYVKENRFFFLHLTNQEINEYYRRLRYERI